MDQNGCYKYHCPTHKIDYVGETNHSYKIRDQELKRAAEKGNWSHSGLTQHKRECSAPISEPEIFSTENQKMKKDQLKHHLCVQESLFIRRYDCGPNRGMNEDWGAYVKTSAWAPVFNRM